MFDRAHDARVRAAAFEWLRGKVDHHGDVLEWADLARGFELDGKRVRLIGQQGIFKPAVLRVVPLSITTSTSGPYRDEFHAGTLGYRYRGTDPNHRDNVGLREAMRLRLPLVYFLGIGKAKYLATWPVFVVNDEPAALTFRVQVDDAAHLGLTPEEISNELVRDDTNEARRAYVTAQVRVRLHQRTFRERVLDAYRRQCAFCRLRHEELLDAAHIIPDRDPAGEPVVRNGLALCTLHHSAFDRHFVGLDPNFRIEVRADILREEDGPTLTHAIKGLHGTAIWLPRSARDRPDPGFVAKRYEEFRSAG
jgi:putative restriction endonuclease